MAADWYPSDWKPKKLSELGKINRGRSRHRPRYAAYLYGGPYPFIQTGDIKASGGKITSYSQTYSESGLAQSRLWPIGTLCITIAANIAETGILTFPACFPDSVVGFIADKTKSDVHFVEYMFRYLRSHIQHEATGSVQDNINLATLERLQFPTPPLPEQHAIADILGALDDKIELNQRMNATLESMARAVFLEMSKRVNQRGSILEFANLLSGGTPSTAQENYWNGNTEWVSAKDVGNSGGIFLLNTEKKITQEGIDNSSTKLLPEKTTIVTARGTVGAHCMLGKPMTMNQTNYGLKAKKGIGDYFIYFTLSEMVEQLKQQSYGTIFDTITTKTFQSVYCVQPSIDVIQEFEDQVTPFMDAILNNQKESLTLASLRDTLLPKLMRGEVRVKDVGKEL